MTRSASTPLRALMIASLIAGGTAMVPPALAQDGGTPTDAAQSIPAGVEADLLAFREDPAGFLSLSATSQALSQRVSAILIADPSILPRLEDTARTAATSQQAAAVADGLLAAAEATLSTGGTLDQASRFLAAALKLDAAILDAATDFATISTTPDQARQLAEALATAAEVSTATGGSIDSIVRLSEIAVLSDTETVEQVVALGSSLSASDNLSQSIGRMLARLSQEAQDAGRTAIASRIDTAVALRGGDVLAQAFSDEIDEIQTAAIPVPAATPPVAALPAAAPAAIGGGGATGGGTPATAAGLTVAPAGAGGASGGSGAGFSGGGAAGGGGGGDDDVSPAG